MGKQILGLGLVVLLIAVGTIALSADPSGGPAEVADDISAQHLEVKLNEAKAQVTDQELPIDWWARSRLLVGE